MIMAVAFLLFLAGVLGAIHWVCRPTPESLQRFKQELSNDLTHVKARKAELLAAPDKPIHERFDSVIRRRLDPLEHYQVLEASIVKDLHWVEGLLGHHAVQSTGVGSVAPPLRRRGRAGRCALVLRFASRLLPATTREACLEEWVDEIYTADEAGLPVKGRVTSILARALPSTFWRERVREIRERAR